MSELRERDEPTWCGLVSRVCARLSFLPGAGPAARCTQPHLWRVVDHEDEVLEALVTTTRDREAASKVLREALRRHGSPERIVTDRYWAYGAAPEDLGAGDGQETDR